MFGFIDNDEYRLARKVLDRGQYHGDAITETLGKEDWFSPHAIDGPPSKRRARGTTPHSTLIRLLLLGCDVAVDDVRRALQPMSVEQWIQAGLLRVCESGDQICSRMRLTPVNDLIFAADTPHLDTLEAPSDFVMPPGGSSLQVGWSAIPRASRRTLDLGTGCGYLGIVAAPFSERIVATDRNERAAAIARFNALLNGIDQMESRAGSLFDPIADEERFDLVLSNPPFVITPQRRLMFRDSGMRGDEFCRNLVREMPTHLEEQGFFQMLTNCVQTTDTPWTEEVSGWFSDLGCDALVLLNRQQPIDEYAMSWITTTESQDITVVPKMFDEWMEFYERERIENISFVHVSLRKQSGAANWIHVEDEPVMMAERCGESILRRFALLDYLASLPNDEALLEQRFVLDADAWMVQEHRMTDDGPRVAANRCEMRGGLRHTVNMDGHVTRLLVYCDGQHPLRQVLTNMAEMLGTDLQQVAKIALPGVRHLIQRGILVPMQLPADSAVA